MMIWLKEKLRQRNLDRPLRILPLMTLPMYVPVRVLITVDHLEYTPIVPAYICTHNVNIRKTLLKDPAYVSSHGDPITAGHLEYAPFCPCLSMHLHRIRVLITMCIQPSELTLSIMYMYVTNPTRDQGSVS